MDVNFKLVPVGFGQAASAEPEYASPVFLGGKGAGLLMMASQGLPVPPAVVIPTTFCAKYQKDPEGTLIWIKSQLEPLLKTLSDELGYMPLFSVRSGARVSMPGMMDTILNVGLDEATMNPWIERLGAKCTMNSYGRLIEMFGSVAKGIDRKKFHGTSVIKALEVFKTETGSAFPDFAGQLMQSIAAVFESWNNPRAQVYRELNKIPDHWGTAVVVQSMVFGNLNQNSGTGVLFTRDPDSGAKGVVGEFLPEAQGEDVVAGSATPQKLSDMKAWNPAVYEELISTVLRLEELKKYPQDVEFTVQDGKLYVLQTRNAKRSARAALRWALDLSKEGVLTRHEAIQTVKQAEFDLAQQAVLDPKFKTAPNFTGIAASTGVVTGKVAFTVEDVVHSKEPMILVSNETTPDDLVGMIKSVGVLTMTGGATSHAAVVARSLNRACVVGLSVPLSTFNKNETISIDGATGRVWKGAVDVIAGGSDSLIHEFKLLMRLATGQKLISRDPLSRPDALYLTDSLMLPSAEVAQKVVFTLSKLAPKQKLVVVFDAPTEEMTVMASMLGIDLEAAATFAMGLVPNELLERLVVFGVHSNGSWAVKTMKTVEELILANGSFAVSPSLENSKAGAQVLKWLKSDGVVPSESVGAMVSEGMLTSNLLA